MPQSEECVRFQAFALVWIFRDRSICFHDGVPLVGDIEVCLTYRRDVAPIRLRLSRDGCV